MESPPPYMPPVKKSNTSLIIWLVVGGVVLCCILPVVLLGGGLLWGFNKSKGLIQCSFAFTDVRDALRLYAADHGGKLPNAENWQDEVTSYYSRILEQDAHKERRIFGTMPAQGLWGCDNGSGGRTGIAFNDAASGADALKIESSNEVLLFEIQTAAKNAHGKYETPTDAGAPQLFGKSRGWFLVRMSRAPALYSEGREVEVNTGPNG